MIIILFFFVGQTIIPNHHILCHFLKENFEMINFALATIPTNDHTGENLSTEIMDVIQSSVMPKTARLIQEEDSMASFEFWGCVGHLLNLVVKHALYS